MGFYNNIRYINNSRIKWLAKQPSILNWNVTWNNRLLSTQPKDCTKRQLQRATKIGRTLMRSLPKERRDD